MRNPLYKRLPRELRQELGKYVVLFLFMVLMIGLICGYMVADGSMVRAYNESFDKYEVENGHFSLATREDDNILLMSGVDLQDADLGLEEMVPMMFGMLFNETDDSLVRKAEAKGVEVEPMFYKDKTSGSGLAEGDSIRVYKDRTHLNRIAMFEGRKPEADDEILVDRLYAENRGLEIGQEIDVDGRMFTICGTCAFSDYSALFKTNTEMMFDANHFTVAVVTDAAWDAMDDNGLRHCYAWRNIDQTLDDDAQRDLSDEIRDELAPSGRLTDIVARPDNNALMFTGDDMSSDMVMMQTLLYIVMVIMAFVFAISARSTIEREALAIGTLRASGFTRGELLWHYITLPILVTLVAALIGNILGYTCMKGIIVQAYYHSYSLPPYVTVWNGMAFLKTTVIPMIIIVLVNLLVIAKALRHPPLQFLRKELRSGRSRKALRLPRHWRFPVRFRARVILQNRSAYLTMLLGISLSAVLLLFGIMMKPLLANFREVVLDSKIAEYQYILKFPVSVDNETAEKYAICTLENERDESIGVYGFERGSAYFGAELPEGDEVYVSSSYMEKYRLKEGQELVLHDPFEDDEYRFIVKQSYEYPSTLCIFLSLDRFNEVMGNKPAYFTGYLSDEPLDGEINRKLIASTITERDLMLTADQLESSMGVIFSLFGIFAVLLYVLILYLLARIAIERNAYSISMVKILGYSDGEIGMLYNRATGVVVVLSLVFATGFAGIAINWIYFAMMQRFTGWLPLYIPVWCYAAVGAIGLACYGLVSRILLGQIRRIPMAEALKGVE
ncbi:MAG: ABC transporter permease [Mogibacterium sp.]|nr:ABC transporter permease [Mogibacterium sp.]